MLMPSLFYDDFNLFDDVFGGPWFGKETLWTQCEEHDEHRYKRDCR